MAYANTTVTAITVNFLPHRMGNTPSINSVDNRELSPFERAVVKGFVS